MISLPEAQAHVLDRVVPTAPTEVHPRDAIGCVLAEVVISSEAVPPFDNTAMDGFAVRAADTVGAPVALRIDGTLLAGGDPSSVAVGPGGAVRIMTGAAMPAGADAVVMVERTALVDETTVRVEVAVEPGQHVRRAGDDIAIGAEVAPAGTVVTPGLAGVFASTGTMAITIHRRPRVGVLSTGDELVEGGGPLRPGQIRESNRQVLLPLLAEAGFDAVDLGSIADDEVAITAAIEGAATHCDALLTSGGVSMGDVDLVKVVLDRIGEMRWMQIAIRPAKPFAFGVVRLGGRAMPVFGLPGNPVSSVVSFELLARPALRRMLGLPANALDRLRLSVVMPEGLPRRADGKVLFARVHVVVDPATGGLIARSAGAQGSHQLAGLAAANALAVVPDGDGVLPGGSVEVIVLGEIHPAS